MAEERVDGIVVTSRFDETGLDRSAQAQLDALRRFVSQAGNLAAEMPALNIDTEGLQATLRSSGTDVAQFFSGLTTEVEAGLGALGASLGLATENVQALQTGLRAGITEELARFGVAATEASQAADQLGSLPTPTLDVRPLHQSGEQLAVDVRGLVQSTDQARVRLAEPILLAPVNVRPLLQAGDQLTAGFLPVLRTAADARRLLATPIPIAPPTTGPILAATASITAGLTQLTAAVGRTGDALRAGVVTDLQRFGGSVAEARRAVGGLGDLPTPSLDVGPLLTAGERLVAGLLPVVRATEEARQRLGLPFSIPPIESAQFRTSGTQVVVGLQPVFSALTDVRARLTQPLTIPPIDPTPLLSSGTRLIAGLVPIRTGMDELRRLLAVPIAITPPNAALVLRDTIAIEGGLRTLAGAVVATDAALRAGVVEGLERFGVALTRARQSVGNLGTLPTPTLTIGPLLESGDRLVTGLQPVLRAVEDARTRLRLPITVPPIDSAPLRASADRALASLAPVFRGITDARRLLANPVTVAPVDSTRLRASAAQLISGLLPVRVAIEDTRRLLANPIPVTSLGNLSGAQADAAAQAQRLAQAQQAAAREILETVSAYARATRGAQDLTAAQVQQGLAASRAAALSRGVSQAGSQVQQQTVQAQRLAAAQAQLRTSTQAVGRAAAQMGTQVGQSRASVHAMAAAMGQATAGANAWRQGLANVQAQQVATTGSTVAFGAGANRVRAGLTAIAVSASGTSPAIAQIVSGLLLLGPGSGVVLGVAAGVAVIASAYRLLTSEARAAREATERLAAAGAARVQSAEPQTTQVSRELAAVETRRALAAREVLQIERENAEVVDGMIFGWANAIRLQTLSKQLVQDQNNIIGLGIQLERARRAEIEQVNSARRAAVLGGIQAEVQAAQVGNAIHQQANEQRFAEGLQGLTDYYRQRVGLTEEGVQAEIRALEAQRRVAESVPIQTAGSTEREIQLQRIAKAAEVDRLTATIALTRQQGELDKQRLIDLRTLAQQALLFQTALVIPPAIDKGLFTLKPRIDATEILAAVDNIQAVFARGLGDDEIERARRAALSLQTALNGVNLRLKDIGNANIKAPADALRDMERATADVLRGLDSMLGAASNIGLIGEEASRSLGNVISLGDALSRIGTEASFGNILGGIAAGLNLISGAFAPTERDRIQEENIRALRENTAELRNRVQGVGGQQNVVDAIQAILTAPRSRFDLGISETPGGIGNRAQARIEQDLDRFGLSLADLEQFARDRFGLQILTDSGKIVASEFHNLEVATRELIQESLRFKDTFAEQILALDLRDRIAGVGQDPAAEFQRQLEALGRVGADGLVRQFDGIDLANETAVRQALLSLFDAFANQQLTPADFDKATRDDFLDFLNKGADFLETFNTQVDEASRQMLNIPTGFKLARLAFEASDVGPPPVPVPPPPPPPPPVPPPPSGPKTADVVAFATAQTESLRAEVVPAIDRLGLQSPPDILSLLNGMATHSPADLLAAVGGTNTELQRIVDLLGGRRGTDGAALPVGKVGGPTSVTIHVTQRPNEDPVAFAERVAEAVRYRGHLQSGNSLQTGNL